MVEASQRAAYLRALGIEQWQPRFVPQKADLAPSPTSPEKIEAPVPQAVAEIQLAEVAAIETLNTLSPQRECLQDDGAVALLEQAAVSWRSPPHANVGLAVLGIDACGSQLQAASFDREWDTLQKMLVAIGQDLNQCAVGGLNWQSFASGVAAPFALVLVDSGEDRAALIQYWCDKTLLVQGATAVIAPHPRMFGQGTAIKRQAWNSLQMLQKIWAA